jgi:hypothetical protein
VAKGLLTDTPWIWPAQRFDRLGDLQRLASSRVIEPATVKSTAPVGADRRSSAIEIMFNRAGRDVERQGVALRTSCRPA